MRLRWVGTRSASTSVTLGKGHLISRGSARRDDATVANIAAKAADSSQHMATSAD